MSQQVNLFNPSLVKAKDWFSLRTVAFIYLVAFVLMYVFYNQYSQAFATIQAERNQVVAAYEASQKKLNEISSRKQVVVNTKDDEVMVSFLQQKMENQTKVIEIFKSVQSGKQAHVSDYLRGLAHVPLNNLWVTGLKLEPFNQNVTLKGRALSADLVPAYIQKLGQDAVFSGQLFGGLKLTEIELQTQVNPTSATTAVPATSVSANVVAPQPPGMPPIKEGNRPVATPPAASPNKAATVTTKAIAFEIVGMNIDSNSQNTAASGAGASGNADSNRMLNKAVERDAN